MTIERPDHNEHLGSITPSKREETLAMLQEMRERLQRGHALNALYGNVAPDMGGRSPQELLEIAQPSSDELAKLVAHGLVEVEPISDLPSVR